MCVCPTFDRKAAFFVWSLYVSEHTDVMTAWIIACNCPIDTMKFTSIILKFNFQMATYLDDSCGTLTFL